MPDMYTKLYFLHFLIAAIKSRNNRPLRLASSP